MSVKYEMPGLVKYIVQSPDEYYDSSGKHWHMFTNFFNHESEAKKEVVRRMKMGVPAWIIEVQ